MNKCESKKEIDQAIKEIKKLKELDDEFEIFCKTIKRNSYPELTKAELNAMETVSTLLKDSICILECHIDDLQGEL